MHLRKTRYLHLNDQCFKNFNFKLILRKIRYNHIHNVPILDI